MDNKYGYGCRYSGGIMKLGRISKVIKYTGQKKYTHEELLYAHERQEIALTKARVRIRQWKDRALSAEKKFSEYVFIDKKPDYFYSWSGLLIFRRFYRLHGFEPLLMEFIIVMSYQEVFLRADFKLYRRNWIDIWHQIDTLIKRGYVQKIKVPGKSKIKMRIGYTLTQRGRDLEKDYERFYNEKIEEARNGKFTRFGFEDGAYFRRRMIFRHERRLAQGGGRMKRAKLTEMWQNIVPVGEENNIQNNETT